MIGPPRLARRGTAADDLLETLAAQNTHAPRGDVVRLAVRLRARDACEYCLMPTRGTFHVDHVIPPRRWAEASVGPEPPARRRGAPRPVVARRGPDHVENYAWSCPLCTEARGRWLAADDAGAGGSLFDPRRDRWRDHFAFVDGGAHIAPLGDAGWVTAAALELNDHRPNGPVALRRAAVAEAVYPPQWARDLVISQP